MPEPSVIEINLTAVSHNVRVLRRIVGPGCRICPVIKADGYGLGAGRIGRRLAADGVDMLAVYTAEQAAELFARATGVPVLVLMPITEIRRTGELYRGLTCGTLHLSVHGPEHLDDLVAVAGRFGSRLRLHLAVDTGMGCGACRLEDAPQLLQRIAANPRLVLAGIYTHFACADRDVESTELQLRAFDRLLEAQSMLIPPDCIVHAANTYATLRGRRYHKSMIRIGLGWAGYGIERMEGGRIDGLGDELRPTVSWRSRLVHIKTIESGAGIGYGRTWTAPRRSRIGLVPVGYADGYPSTLRGPSERAEPSVVEIDVPTVNGTRRMAAPVVGAINMDQITVDLTDVDAARAPGAPALAAGATVHLISADPAAPTHLTRVAARAGMLPHVMLCGLSPRVPRIYRDEMPLVEVGEGRAAVRSQLSA